MPIVRIQVVVIYNYVFFLVESITKFACENEGPIRGLIVIVL